MTADRDLLILAGQDDHWEVFEVRKVSGVEYPFRVGNFSELIYLAPEVVNTMLGLSPAMPGDDGLESDLRRYVPAVWGAVTIRAAVVSRCLRAEDRSWLIPFTERVYRSAWNSNGPRASRVPIGCEVRVETSGARRLAWRPAPPWKGAWFSSSFVWAARFSTRPIDGVLLDLALTRPGRSPVPDEFALEPGLRAWLASERAEKKLGRGVGSGERT